MDENEKPLESQIKTCWKVNGIIMGSGFGLGTMMGGPLTGLFGAVLAGLAGGVVAGIVFTATNRSVAAKRSFILALVMFVILGTCWGILMIMFSNM